MSAPLAADAPLQPFVSNDSARILSIPESLGPQSQILMTIELLPPQEQCIRNPYPKRHHRCCRPAT